MSIKVIAFDLDDTLLNTTELLVPKASKQAFSLLIEHGLTLSLDQCEAFRLDLIKQISHKDLFKHLAEKYGSPETINYADLASQLFYNPQLPDDLQLVEGAQKVLDYCYQKYTLYLVTAGFEHAQIAKTKNLKIEKYFKQIFVVNSLENQKKKTVFQQILKQENLLPSNLLCVGNSLSSEIKDAKEINAKTCYFEFGEDRGHSPLNPIYKPDFHVNKMDDFIKTCQI